MGRFLVQMHHSGYDRFGSLILLDELQRFIEELTDFSSFLSLEKLRRSGYESFHHTNAVRACAASGFCNLTLGFSSVLPFGLDITPEMVAEAITGSVSGMEGVDPEALKQFNQALIGLLTVKPTEDEHDGS